MKRCCLGMCRLSIVDYVAKLASKENYMLAYIFTIMTLLKGVLLLND